MHRFLLAYQKVTMKTSETWNQGFEEMRFDTAQGHMVNTEDNLHPGMQQPCIFESQELPIGRTQLTNRNHVINIRNPDSNSGRSGRGQERYEYSQTENGQSSLEHNKGQESQQEDKNMKILDNSHNSHPQQVTRNQEDRTKNQNNPLPQNQPNVQNIVFPQNQIPQGIPPHPNQNMYQGFPEQVRPLTANELENMASGVQKSYAPSQKTIVMSHNQGLAPGSPVYRSHVATERLQSQASDRLDKRMMTSPNNKGNHEANQQWQEGGARSTTNANPQMNLQISQAQWWRDKYEELRHQFETVQARNLGQFQALTAKMNALDHQNKYFRENYEKLAKEYNIRVEEIKSLKERLNQPQTKGHPQPSDPEIKRQIQERGMLITLLKKENEQFKEELQHKNEQYTQLESYNQELQQTISVLRMELQQKQEELLEHKKPESAIKANDLSQFSRSRVQSVQNTKILDLEMQTGRLMTQIQQERKISALKFKELVEKYESTVMEKDQIIRNLQEKTSILESDLNKKDSLLRNLRDELVEAERKKTSPTHNSVVGRHSPLHSTTGSAINPPIQRSERVDKEEAKRQIDNLRKHLFDKERELTIQNQRQQELKEILMETQNTAGRRKTEMQTLRRQIAQQQDKLAELEMLKETLQKKNEEIAEMREILIEKQYSGEYQSLTKENEKLREISIKRNAEISDLSDRLLAAQKKIREQESFNPQIEALEQEVQMLNNHIRSQQSDIERLTISLEHSNEKVLEAELQIQKERQRQMQLQNLLSDEEGQLQELSEKVQKGEQKEQLLERELESYASKMVKLERENEELLRAEEMYKEKLNIYQKELANQAVELQTVSQKHNQLEMFKAKSLKEIENIEEQLTREIEIKNEENHLMSGRLRELETLTKFQKDKLAKIQPEFQQMREKYVKHQHCQKIINELTERVANYEMKMLNAPHARQLFHHVPNSGSKVFQNKLIYQLKHQNQNLKTNLKRATSPSSQSLATEQADIKSRLNQFATKLQETLTEEQCLRKAKSHDNLHSPKKIQTVQLQSSLHKQQFQQSVSLTSLQDLQKFYNQKMTYYRIINLQLQQRNNSLLQLTQQLKENLSRVTLNKDHQLKQFYDQQLRIQKEKSQKLEKQLYSIRRQAKKRESQIMQLKKNIHKFQSPENVSYSYTLKEKISEWRP